MGPAEVKTDGVPSTCGFSASCSDGAYTVEQYANNPIGADHGRLKARLRPMRAETSPVSADPRRRSRLRAESAPPDSPCRG